MSVKTYRNVRRQADCNSIHPGLLVCICTLSTADFNTDPVRIADISVSLSPVDVIYATSQPSRVLITSVVTTAMASDAPCFVALRRIHACSMLRLKYGGIFLAVYKKFVA